MRKSDLVEQELISIPFGHSKIDALFYKSLAKSRPVKEPVIIHIHGFLGNFLEGSQRYLPPLLAEAGYSSLSINTRMATFGLFFGYGIIDDTIPQIDTAIVYLKNLGYSRIILSGYSLGSSIVLRYASLRSDRRQYPSLKGIIALSTPYSTADTIRNRWNRWGSNPSYEEIYRRVKETLKPDPDTSSEDRTMIIYKARGDTLNPEHTELYTYKTWWHLAGPEAESSRSYKQISDVKLPIILIQGREDAELGAGEADGLATIARDSGNSDVSVVYLDADHNFEGKEEELGDVIKEWLDRRFGYKQNTPK